MQLCKQIYITKNVKQVIKAHSKQSKFFTKIYSFARFLKASFFVATAELLRFLVEMPSPFFTSFLESLTMLSFPIFFFFLFIVVASFLGSPVINSSVVFFPFPFRENVCLFDFSLICLLSLTLPTTFLLLSFFLVDLSLSCF